MGNDLMPFVGGFMIAALMIGSILLALRSSLRMYKIMEIFIGSFKSYSYSITAKYVIELRKRVDKKSRFLSSDKKNKINEAFVDHLGFQIMVCTELNDDFNRIIEWGQEIDIMQSKIFVPEYAVKAFPEKLYQLYDVFENKRFSSQGDNKVLAAAIIIIKALNQIKKLGVRSKLDILGNDYHRRQLNILMSISELLEKEKPSVTEAFEIMNFINDNIDSLKNAHQGLLKKITAIIVPVINNQGRLVEEKFPWLKEEIIT